MAKVRARVRIKNDKLIVKTTNNAVIMPKNTFYNRKKFKNVSYRFWKKINLIYLQVNIL